MMMLMMRLWGPEVDVEVQGTNKPPVVAERSNVLSTMSDTSVSV